MMINELEATSDVETLELDRIIRDDVLMREYFMNCLYAIYEKNLYTREEDDLAEWIKQFTYEALGTQYKLRIGSLWRVDFNYLAKLWSTSVRAYFAIEDAQRLAWEATHNEKANEPY